MTAQVLINAGFITRYEPPLTASGKRLTPEWVTDAAPPSLRRIHVGGADDRDAHGTSLPEIEERLGRLPYLRLMPGGQVG